MAEVWDRPSGQVRPLSMLTRYRAWADTLTYRTVLDLAPGEADKPRETTFGSILGTLGHTYVVDDIFRAHWQGAPHGYTSRRFEEPWDAATLWEKTKALNAWYIDQADALSEVRESEVVRFQFVGGGEGAMTRAEILHHIVNHATYHRGFLSVLFSQIPAKGPANDLPVFLRDVWTQ